MIADLSFVVACLAAVSIVGLSPASLLPRGTFRHGLLAAPAIGVAAFGVVVTALYAWGVPPTVGAGVVLGAGVLGCAATRQRWAPEIRSRTALGIAAAFAVLTAAMLGPAWIGGRAFTALQGNPNDALNYAGMALSYHLHPFAALRSMMPGDPLSLTGSFAVDAAVELHIRPGVAVVLAAVYPIAYQTPIEAAYPFMMALELATWSALTFLLAEGFGGALWVCGAVAAAFVLGFFGQYAADIDALAQVAGTPVAVALLAVVMRAATAGVTGSVVAAIAALTGGLLYLYPEMSAVYGTAIAVTVALAMLRFRTAAMARRLGALALAAAAGAALCAPFPSGTIGSLLTQAGATDVPGSWALYFSGYLFAMPYRGGFADSWGHLSADAAYVADGLMGTYFAYPWPMSRAAAILLLLSALACAASAAMRQRRVPALAACLVSVLVPLALVVAGRDWAAGKAFAMASPLWLAALLSPVLFRGGRRLAALPAVVLLALHLGFGAERFADAAGPDGAGRRPPYPAARDQKRAYDFDTARWDRDLAGCRAVEASIDGPALSRMAQIYLAAHGVAWSTPQPISSPFDTPPFGTMPQVAGADCFLTDAAAAAASDPRRVVSLRRPPRPPRFDGSPVEVAVADPADVSISGMSWLELFPGGAARWTDGEGRASVTVAPGARPRVLTVSLGTVSPVGDVTVRLGEALLYSGPQWTGPRDFAIPADVAPGPWTFVLSSGTWSAASDPRRLGVYLTGLKLG